MWPKPTFGGDRGHMPDSMLIQAYIEFEGNTLCGETGRVYGEHIKVHDRFREHLQACDDCKMKLFLWLAQIAKTLNLEAVAMKAIKDRGV